MDVGGWLRKLGLEEYEAAFRENKIDDTILPSLTTEDLKELGVGSVGHRRKLLEAIAALRADTSAKLAMWEAAMPTPMARTSRKTRRSMPNQSAPTMMDGAALPERPRGPRAAATIRERPWTGSKQAFRWPEARRLVPNRNVMPPRLG